MTCRTAFRSAALNCEFIADWRWLDLEDANVGACLNRLRGRDFSGGKLTGVNFSGADLTDTNWSNAQLSGTNFTNVVLDNANFTNARLMGMDGNPAREAADLSFANLSNVVFNEADLSYARLAHAQLTGPKVSLTGATLTGSHWENANLSGANLTGLTALGADFSKATLDNTTLKNTDLGYNSARAESATLSGATLCGATLDATRLVCAKLTDAHVLNAPGQRNADCMDATITMNDTTHQYTTNTDGISNANIKCTTFCPDGGNGPCTEPTQWQSAEPVVKQCCVWKKGEKAPCPARKKGGQVCSGDCDCASQRCLPGDGNRVCASTAALIKALQPDRAEERR